MINAAQCSRSLRRLALPRAAVSRHSHQQLRRHCHLIGNERLRTTPVIHRQHYREVHSISQSLITPYAPITVRSLKQAATADTDNVSGLLNVPGLHKPEDFLTFAAATRAVCDQYVSTITTTPPSLATLSQMDAISDALCRCVDVAELLRNVHPSVEWREISESVVLSMSDYMESLNQNHRLYQSLLALSQDSSKVAAMSDEERRVMELFLKEMENKGIHLTDRQKMKIADYQNNVTALINQFSNNVNQHSDTIEIDDATNALYQCLPRSLTQRFQRTNSHGRVRIPIDNDSVSTLLKFMPDDKVRRSAYLANSVSVSDNDSVLRAMMTNRHLLALECRYDSYANYHTASLVAQSSAFVTNFLTQLIAAVKPTALRELALLTQYKQKLNSTGTDTGSDAYKNADVEPWDVSYYMGYIKSLHYHLNASELSHYFTVTNCLNGLDAIFQRLFSLRLVRTTMNANEDYTSQYPQRLADYELMKLEAYDIRSGELKAVIYLDLFARENKFRGGAAFVVQSRKLIADQQFQLPVMTIVASFSRPSATSNGELLLTHSQCETLFHEFGHVTHHILCQNHYQHLSGARGELDFVELPSILFENFVYDYDVLSKFAYHYRTGAVIPRSLVQRLNDSKQLFLSFDLLSQSLLALFDQTIFGERALEYAQSSESLAAVYRALNDRHGILRHSVDSRHYLSNTHLCHYGAGYYTYLMCRIYAMTLWNKYFAHNALSRDAGTFYTDQVLRYGGAKNPREILQELLGTDLNAPIAQFLAEQLNRQ